MDITELIDAAAQAAVEHNKDSGPLLEKMLAVFGTYRRPDGLYAVTDKMVEVYHPAEDDEKEIEAARRGVIVNGENVATIPNIWTTSEKRESAFRRFNYVLLTNNGVPPVEARAKINAAIMAGDIN